MAGSDDPVPPFIRNDQGDMWAFDRLPSHGVESYDAEATEVFDSYGRIMRPVVDGFVVRFEADLSAAPQFVTILKRQRKHADQRGQRDRRQLFEGLIEGVTEAQ